jgi:hypothetical protein
MRLTKLTLIEVADLEEQYRHPFEFNVGGDVLQSIESLVRSNHGNLSPDLFIGTASEALRLSSEAEEVGIAGRTGRRAWRENRYRFIAEVEIEGFARHRNSATRAFVVGYTDRVDLSHENTVAPDLEMYVNSVVLIRDIEKKDRRGRTYISSKVLDSQQTMLGDIDITGRSGGSEYLMRPYDLFNTVDTHKETGRHDDSIDLRNTFQYGVEMNRRDSNDSNRYLAQVVAADRQGLGNLRTYSNDIMDMSRESEAADILRPQRVDSNLFLKAIASRSNYAEDNFFEYRDLVPFTDRRSLQDLDEVTKIAPIAHNIFSFESEVWYGASPETMAAAQVCHAIPIIMLGCLFSFVQFRINNLRTYDREPQFILEDSASYIGEDFDDISVIDTFKGRVIREVFNVISNNGYFDVDLSVSSEEGGFTRVEISIDDNPTVPYVFPSFADAMLTPVVTRNKSLIDDNAERYVDLRKKVDEAIDDFVGGKGRIDTTSRIRDGKVEDTNRRRNSGLDLLDLDLPSSSRRRR